MITELRQLAILLQQLVTNITNSPSYKLYLAAKDNVGKDLSPTQNEYGCAETVNTLCTIAYGEPAGGGVSTASMYESLLSSYKWQKTSWPTAGCIIISPTGYGNGKISNGHVGVLGLSGRIYSNNSYNSLLEENYNLPAWKARYVDVGGFPMDFFKRIIN